MLSSRDFEGAKKALDKSSEWIEWGGKKLIWDETIDGIDSWNYKMIYELPKYVFTSHAMIIHQDGYVINPQRWDPEWLKLDFIGAPWPLPQDSFSYRDEEGDLQRVGNSVSLRSKKLMDLVARQDPEWFWEQKRRYGNCNEDGFITCHNRKWLEKQGCRFATLEEACWFSKEHEIDENRHITEPFAFHSL